MYALPHNAPANLYEAFAYIGSVRHATIDDLKLMLLLEAAGKEMYDDLAADAADPEIRSLLTEADWTNTCTPNVWPGFSAC